MKRGTPILVKNKLDKGYYRRIFESFVILNHKQYILASETDGTEYETWDDFKTNC